MIIVLVQRFANRQHNLDSYDDDLRPAHDQRDGRHSHQRRPLGDFDQEGQADYQLASGREWNDDDDAGEDSLPLSMCTDPEVLALGEPFISLLPHLPKILCLLRPDPLDAPALPRASDPSTSSPMSVPGVLGSRPFGSLRMKVVELCLVLARSRSPLVDSLLAEYNVAGLMTSVWFAYPWNNLLHGLVESIVASALEEPDSLLTQAFWKDGLLVDTLVEGWQRNEAHLREGKMRLGYMGHLIRSGVTLDQQFQSLPPPLRESLLGSSAARWRTFVDECLGPELAKQQSDDLEAMTDGGMGDLGLTSSSTQLQDLNHQAEHDPHQQYHHHHQMQQIFPEEDEQEETSSDDDADTLGLAEDDDPPMDALTTEE